MKLNAFKVIKTLLILNFPNKGYKSPHINNCFQLFQPQDLSFLAMEFTAYFPSLGRREDMKPSAKLKPPWEKLRYNADLYPGPGCETVKGKTIFYYCD